MGSKVKKLAKKLIHATNEVISHKKSRQHAELIEKSAKKLAKKLLKKEMPEGKVKVKKAKEVKAKPKVWKSDSPEKKEGKAD